MRTLCGIGRTVQVVLRAGRAAVASPSARGALGGDPAAAGDARTAARPPVPAEPALLSGTVGEQRRHGVLLDQVDGRTCGSAVLVALAAWLDPTETARLGPPETFGVRYDQRQRQVHRETNRFWPRALGTTPWGMLGWLRRHLPAAGRYRLRLVDDATPTDVASAVAATTAALTAQRPVPMLVGSLIPRHWVLAVSVHEPDRGHWRVYEPSSGSVRLVDPAWVSTRALRPVLGFARLHAVLLPAEVTERGWSGR